LKLPLTKIYTLSSPVHVAKITKLNEANRSIEADAENEKLRLQLINPAGLFGQLKVGDAVIVFVAKGRASNMANVHLADTWLLATVKPESNPPIWQISQEQSNDFKKAFPGSTGALAQVIGEYKQNKPTFLSTADERVFTQGAQQIAQLSITANGLFVADLNNDKTPELIIATPHGPQILGRGEGGYDIVAKKFAAPESGNLLAIGDLNGDSKPDLLIDKTVYLLQENGFKPGAPLDFPAKADLLAVAIADGRVFALSKSGHFSNGIDTKQLWTQKDSAPALAAVIGAFDEENKTAAIVVTQDSLTRYSSSGTRADFTRLTGEPLSNYLKDSGGKFKNPKLVPLDANGDKRMDLLVLSEGGNFLLINRGFGAYFVSPAAAHAALAPHDKPEEKYPFAASATSAYWAAVDTRNDGHHDLLVLTPDGALYRLSNPPHVEQK